MSLLKKYSYLHAANKSTPNAPLIVMFHGYGSNKEDLFELRHGLGERYDYLALQAPMNLAHMGMPNGNAWFDIEFTDEGIGYEPEVIEPLVEEVVTLIKEISEVFAGKRKLYLLGFSQGAIICHSLLLRAGEYVDAAACLSGFYADELFVDGQDWSALDKKPLFVSHGVDDDVIPLEVGGTAIHDYYQDSPVEMFYKEYDMGHGISYDCQNDLKRWLGALK